jgi:glycosyltransferase involved in cell wall biosynthesis
MSNERPRLSIGLPVYNGETFLRAALDSLLAQSFGDFEIIISDNASTDKTAEICQEYVAKDQRIQYSHLNQNIGAAPNFNYVFNLARGEFFKWAAHDDICAPTFFEKCITILDSHPDVVLVYPQTTVIDSQGQEVEYYPDKLDLRSESPSHRFREYHRVYQAPYQCHPVFGIVRTHDLAKTALIGSYVSSDRVLLGELVLRGKIYEIQEKLFYSRFHPDSSVRKYPEFRDLVVWFDPKKRGKLQMVRWIMLSEYLAAIRRTKLSKREKTTCYLLMGQWLIWNRRGLLKDTLKGLFWPVVRPAIVKKIKAPGSS